MVVLASAFLYKFIKPIPKNSFQNKRGPSFESRNRFESFGSRNEDFNGENKPENKSKSKKSGKLYMWRIIQSKWKDYPAMGMEQQQELAPGEN